MSQLHRITVDPNVLGGRPCIRGLRVRVKDVLDMLAGGATREQIAEIPVLRGVLCYAADRDDAVANAQTLAARVLAERAKHGEASDEQR